MRHSPGLTASAKATAVRRSFTRRRKTWPTYSLAPLPLLLLPRPHRPCHHLRLPLFLELSTLVLLPGQHHELVLQLQIALQSRREHPSFRDGGLHRAARLPAVPAVREITLGRECLDLVEGLAHRFSNVPQLQ